LYVKQGCPTARVALRQTEQESLHGVDDLSHKDRVLKVGTCAYDILYGIDAMYHHGDFGDRSSAAKH
jgi:hypothetical protein